MKNVTFNILKAIQNLRDAGFSESQASAIVGMMGASAIKCCYAVFEC